VLIAEDLLLLLLDDHSGAAQSAYLQPALGGALLVELALAGNVNVEANRRWRAAKVGVVPGVAAPSDPVLAGALATVAEKQRSAQDLVGRLGAKHVRDQLADRLVERGILERRESRVLGIFPRHRWPSVDASHEDGVRRSLAAVLVGGQEPDPRTASLVALLSALDRVHKTVDHDGLGNRELKRRAKEIAEGNWAAAGVRAAIQAATAATAAVIAATTASAAGSS
jgi:hypothetical protein